MKRFMPLFFLVACGPSQEEFEEDSWAVTCDLIFECTDADTIEAAGVLWIFGETASDCYALLDAATDSGTSEAECEYDKAAAKECLDELEALTCDDYASDGPSVSACDRVCGE